MRIDYPTSSVITNPAAGQMLLLDHVKKEVTTIPLPAAVPPQLAAQLKAPGMPGAPAPPAAPAMSVKDLGKRLIEGHEVAGMQFTTPPLTPPKPPGAPQAAIPGMPGAPQLPPKPEPKAMVSEVWTSTSLHVPILSRITGSFGQQICHCKNAVGGEPPASAFQIPADYKPAGLPAAPAMPAAPKAPAMPKFPSKG
jgi:hypothetical protein